MGCVKDRRKGTVSSTVNSGSSTATARQSYLLKEGKKEEIDYVKGQPARVREFDAKGVMVKESEIYEEGSQREI